MEIIELVDLIRKNTQHSYIYHFTDETNFSQIKKYGLLSKNKMLEIGLWPQKPSGNQLSWDLDDAKGISDYVSLSMTHSHPMCYIAQTEDRILTPRHLCIDPEVLLGDNVLFAPDIANKNGVNLTPLRDSIDLIDHEVLYSRTDWADPSVQLRLKQAERYEILIPVSVPLTMIPRVI